jgi:multidrug efflux pump subunit AcrA (membrane-fusion protein)
LEDVRSYYDSDYKANISELWGNVFQQLQATAAMVEQIPEMAIIAKPAIMSMIRGYKVGAFVEQQMEEAIDKAIAAYEQRMAQPQQPSPDMIKAQNEQAKIQLDSQKLQLEAQKTGAQLQNTSMKDRTALQLENKRADAEIAKIVSDTEINKARLTIMKQDADRKERELDAEIKLAMFKALHPEVSIDTNLGSIA